MRSATMTLAYPTQTSAKPMAHQMGVGSARVTVTLGSATPYKLRILDTGRNAR